MQVEGSTSPVPFRYEFDKVGYGIKVALAASRSDGQPSFVQSADDYFYRRASASNPPVFIVAFGSVVVNYRHAEDAQCQL